MKNYINILISFLLLITACKEPNATGPDTDATVNEVVEYEVIEPDGPALQLENITENIIRSKSDLNSIITNTNYTTNPTLFDRLNKINFNNNTLVIISGRSVAELSRITLDTIFVDANGKVQLDYRVYRKLGDNQRVIYSSLFVLIKNRIRPEINLRRKDMIEGEIPQFDGFETIAKDIEVDTRRKWKSVFRSENEFKTWAAEFGAKETEFIKEVDFDKEIVISVGTGHFSSGEYSYLIRDIKQQGNRLIVNSTFSVINHQVDLHKPNNHFVRIKKTSMYISFTPSLISNIVNPSKELYYENFRIINLEAEEETEKTVSKVSNLAELFSVIHPNDDLSTNTEIDFEFFDLLVIKAPTQKVKTLKHEIGYIERDNKGITGKVTLYPNFTGNSQKYDAYTLIKILKTNIPISDNFEVIIK